MQYLSKYSVIVSSTRDVERLNDEFEATIIGCGAGDADTRPGTGTFRIGLGPWAYGLVPCKNKSSKEKSI